MSQWLEDVEKLYSLLETLRHKLGGARLLSNCSGYDRWPQRGVYFFFEPGEVRASDSTKQRVVRVGTHAITGASQRTLWQRLSNHRGTSKGSGNHRGSIFRLRIGEALIAQSEGRIQVPTWGIGSSAPASNDPELVLERKVSEYIWQMPFIWLPVEDAPGPQSDRAFIERNSIILLAGADGQSPVDPPSPTWLGNYSPKLSIRKSGLWQTEHVARESQPLAYNPQVLPLIESYVALIP